MLASIIGELRGVMIGTSSRSKSNYLSLDRRPNGLSGYEKKCHGFQIRIQ